jgi:hypothetical protein
MFLLSLFMQEGLPFKEFQNKNSKKKKVFIEAKI